MILAITYLFLCYIIGAVPTGLLIGKQFRGIDVRDHGSKNLGATNVWRVLGWKLGLLTLLIDAGKAFAVVFFAPYFVTDASVTYPVICGVATLLGNFFNLFLGFKGGKGAATSLGVFFALAPFAMAISFLAFFIVVGITRYVSLGSLVATTLLVLQILIYTGFSALFIMVFIMAILVFFKHRANIQRLLAGTENKMRFGAKG